MSDFEPAVRLVLKREGGLNEAVAQSDPGGLTNFGISLRFLKEVPSDRLRKYGIFDDEITENTIRELTKEKAVAIYRGEFWDFFPFEKIDDQELSNYVFDCAINPNPATAFRCLQRAIWTFDGYESLVDDGVMGSKTIACANFFGRDLIKPMMSELAGWYREHANGKFLDGLLRRAYSEPGS